MTISNKLLGIYLLDVFLFFYYVSLIYLTNLQLSKIRCTLRRSLNRRPITIINHMSQARPLLTLQYISAISIAASSIVTLANIIPRGIYLYNFGRFGNLPKKGLNFFILLKYLMIFFICVGSNLRSSSKILSCVLN